MRFLIAHGLCRLLGHVPGERLGRTVWRCARCEALYQRSRFEIINIERQHSKWTVRDAIHGP